MQALMEETCCSTLTFAGLRTSAESARFNGLRRVREPVSRSKSGIQGKVADVFNGRSRHAESLTELHAFRIVLTIAQADAWQEQPCILEYRHGEKRCRYTPDLFLVWGTCRELVEIKTDAEADLPENQAHFGLIRDLLTDHGYYFRVWKKSEILAEPRLSNVSLVSRYRSVEVSAVERERIRRAFASAPEICLRGLRATPGIIVPTVLRLVLEGMLHIDWWKPLTRDSRVSVTPIGRQVWPCPLSKVWRKQCLFMP